jgi:uncharacterized membrane protein YidH (DUF202 family)
VALARERTDLAWTRTSIAFAALGVLLLRVRPVAGVPTLIFSVVIWWLGHLPGRRGAAAGRRLLVITVAVTAMAVAALILTVLGHDSRGLRL